MENITQPVSTPESHLSRLDQNLFKKFGFGPICELPHIKIHKAIEERAQLHPADAAVTFNKSTMSYLVLNEKAEHVKRLLVNRGVKPGDNVGLFLKRSHELVIGILGILKAGAAYVPQDAGVSTKIQLSHIVESAGIDIILSVSEFEDKIKGMADTVLLDKLDCEKTEPLQSNENFVNEQEDSNCFILYTSGTTGVPNGVQVTHRSLCNIILTHPGNLGVGRGDKVAQLLNISFDMSAWEIFVALCHGGHLLVRDKDLEETAAQANIVIATPSVLAGFNVDKFDDIHTVAVAGEPCPIALAEKWHQKARFYNCCGPTETTIVNTMHEFKSTTNKISIGRPTPNNTVYILDDNLLPLPIGALGEMWAGGSGVTAGYLNNPKLNRERYHPDPFLGDGHIMFRTRDLGRWNENGELEHFGRTDDQVKIKGFRVELDSVTSVLESIEGIQQAVTLKLDDKTLVAFVSPAQSNVAAARKAIRQVLPYYCEPKEIISIQNMPLTKRGKIDKRKLTVMAIEKLEEEVRCPA